MAMMCLVCLWHASVFLVYDLNDQDEALVMKCDRIGFGVLLAIYVIFQLTFMIYAAYLVCVYTDLYLQYNACKLSFNFCVYWVSTINFQLIINFQY